MPEQEKITIVATTHMSKMNAASGNSGRGAALGSSAAPAMSEANILLNKRKDGKIKLTAHGRNEPEITRFYKWGDGALSGRLVETDGGEQQDPMVSYLNSLDAETFCRNSVVEFFEKKKLSASSADRGIRKAKKEGWIESCIDAKTGKVRPGYYRKVDSGE